MRKVNIYMVRFLLRQLTGFTDPIFGQANGKSSQNNKRTSNKGTVIARFNVVWETVRHFVLIRFDDHAIHSVTYFVNTYLYYAFVFLKQ